MAKTIKFAPFALAIAATIGAFAASLSATTVAKAASPAYCSGYASKAVKLFQSYRAKGGKRTNTVWNGSYQRHYSHCLGASLNLTSWLQNERYKVLNSGRF